MEKCLWGVLVTAYPSDKDQPTSPVYLKVLEEGALLLGDYHWGIIIQSLGYYHWTSEEGIIIGVLLECYHWSVYYDCIIIIGVLSSIIQQLKLLYCAPS